MLNRLQDVFRSFQQHDVRYVVIGGIASILHGVPRATFDLDILIEATPDNVRRLLQALLDAGLGTAALTSVQAVLDNEITIFKDRVRVDVQTATPGVLWHLVNPEAAERLQQFVYGQITARPTRDRGYRYTEPQLTLPLVSENRFKQVRRFLLAHKIFGRGCRESKDVILPRSEGDVIFLPDIIIDDRG